MLRGRGLRGIVAAGAVSGLLLAAGCGLWPSAKATPDAAVTPGAPPPSLRDAGAQIADEAALKQLVQGKTTKAEVRDRFGVPQEIILSSGVETFIYYRERTSGLVWRTTDRSEMLTVRFDDQGLLKDFEYRFAGK